MRRQSVAFRPPTVFLAGTLLCLLMGQASSAQSHTANEGQTGQDLVGTLCTACHTLNRLTRSSGYTREGWRDLTGTMIDLSGSPGDQEAILDHLVAKYPPNKKRAPRLIPGNVEISFTDWLVPTLGQRPRDPIEAEDGSIWWAGQWANLIGRIDPTTGAMTEYTLPANAMPHTVTLDKAGAVWYTGNKNASLGKLDPHTGKISEYMMPDARARDPHSAIFDRNGTLWFTLQHSNMIGRLIPSTGAVDLVTLKTERAKPYGIKIDAHNVPWVACNGSNCLVKVDPQTMALTEIELPNPTTRVRRLDIAGDGMIWYVNSSMGRLGRFNPKTGAIKEWPSPSGPESHPYALAIVDGIVWYNESGKRPDALVRFDPGNETFQSWAIPSGSIHAGIVRHMRKTRDGNLLIHQSGTNRIILVGLKPG